MSYRLTGLDPAPFIHLFGRPDHELLQHGVRRVVADSKPGFPDRISLRDAEPGERLLLMNYTHLPVDTPYRASHAIFVREGEREQATFVNEIPDSIRSRLVSLRAFDVDGMMLDADVVEGAQLEPLVARFLEDPATSYLHVHFARRGCYAARIERVS